jgi:integrase
MAKNSRPFGLHIPRNGKTYVYNFQVEGRRFSRSTGCTSLREALIVAADARAAAKGLASRTVQPKARISTDAAFDRYFTEHSPNVARPDELLSRLVRLAKYFGTEQCISDLKMDDLMRYQAIRRSEVANRTVNTDIIDTLRPFYAHARKWGVETGPLGQTDFPWKELKLRTPRPRVRWLTRNEKARLYMAVSKDYRPIVKFALLSALRASALLAKKSQIDFEMSVITYQKKSKYDNDLGFIPITSDIERLLRSEMRKSPDDCQFVFTFRARRTYSGKVKNRRYAVTIEGFKSEMQRAVKRAKLENWRQIHDLRHTAATELLKASKDLTATRDLLGHADVAQTEKYAHVIRDDVRRAMEARQAARK